MLFWVTGETDDGMLCAADRSPGLVACDLDTAWAVPFVLSVASALGAVVAWGVAALRPA